MRIRQAGLSTRVTRVVSRRHCPEACMPTAWRHALVVLVQVHLRSLRSKDALRVVFCNTTGEPVTIIWMDFCGGEVSMHAL